MAIIGTTARPIHSTDFIVQFLDKLGRPATVAEIRVALRDNSFQIKDSSLNWTLTNLNTDRRIRRVVRGVYQSTQPHFASKNVSITTPVELRDWLEGKPQEYAHVLIARTALRVLPLAVNVINLNEISGSERSNFLQTLFRASFISWAACNYDPSGMATAAEEASGAAGRVAEETADAAANAIAQATFAAAYPPQAVEVLGAITYAVYATEPLAGPTDLWESISADLNWLIDHESMEQEHWVRKLASERLWLEDVRGNSEFNVNFPIWARNEWDAFKEADGREFDLWVRWYEARLGGSEFGGFSASINGTAAQLVDKRIATKADKFWDRDVAAVNTEIESWFKETFQESTVPIEPSPGPGPQYRPRDGKLSEVPSSPTDDEAVQQAKLHRLLQREAAILAKSLQRAVNRFPELSSVASEYCELLGVETSGADVTAIWSVGGALASFARAYREQNVANTLAEPLEPQLDALLQSVVRQHGAFILGFEEGRDLVQRADEFAVDARRLKELEELGSVLLDELTDNRSLVDDRTREIHRAVRDSTTEFGWVASRVGFSAYLIVRNGLRAMIKFTLGTDPNIGAIFGILSGGSALAGDSEANFIRAALPVLQHHGAQILAFFNHSPEMRAYVEWALRLLEADREGRQ